MSKNSNALREDLESLVDELLKKHGKVFREVLFDAVADILVRYGTLRNSVVLIIEYASVITGSESPL